jgi:hypothetical protein
MLPGIVVEDHRPGRRPGIEQLPADRQVAAAHAIGQKAKVADSHEAGGDRLPHGILAFGRARAMPEKLQFTPAAERPDSFNHRDSLRFSRMHLQ